MLIIALALLVAGVAVARGDSEIDHPNYREYSEETYAATQDKARVLFFHASWCPSCRSAEAGFKETLDDIPENIVILKVNYDKERELKKRYGVTYQHTFVQVDANGEVVTKWSGGALKELLREAVLD